jgi:hypothetical protein
MLLVGFMVKIMVIVIIEIYLLIVKPLLIDQTVC